MQPTLDIRRHSDGSIDLDFYRRRAMRRRRLAMRILVKHCLTAGRRIAGASVLVIANAIIPPWRRSRRRLLVGASAAGAMLIVVFQA